MSGSKGAAVAAAGAVGGKTARACDSCLRRRARWYCAADDAFLCQGCDASVHSANPLARRHERLRLRPATASSPPHRSSVSLESDATAATSTSERRPVAPAWSRRKARTRRPHVKSVGQLLSRKLGVVPESAAAPVESEEERKDDEQLLYRVPTFDHALAELCSPPPVDDVAPAATSCHHRDGDVDGAVENGNTLATAAAGSPVQVLPDSCLASFGPTDAELREFAADMEALLGQGLDDGAELINESFYMESLGFMTPDQEDGGGRVVKMERPDGVISRNGGESALGFGRAEVMDIDFNSGTPTVADDGDVDSSFEQKPTPSASNGCDAGLLRRSLDLRLNYEAVIESWGSSPWTDGHRPHGVQLVDGLIWPDAYHAHSGVWTAAGGGQPVATPRWGPDGSGREARVSRYREKRRTRLFAKKIRYEVRKLNAEKRPRMKGRFVKRSAAGGGAAVAAAPCAVT